MGEKTLVKTDCLHFNGYKPCEPHKINRQKCLNCPHYVKTNKRILIIKLQAAGEVVRNTPLLTRIKREYPNSKIFWLTKFPALVPKNEVHKIIDYNHTALLPLLDMDFDILYSLDKDVDACALANKIKSKVKKGFTQKNGVILPFDKDAVRKWKTGIFDDLLVKNKKHYMEEIFEICGFKFNEEKYILPEYSIPKINIDTSKKIVALNTGVGRPWLTRLYSEDNWVSVAIALKKKGYEVVIVGGPEEDTKNKRISKKSKAKYFGTFSFKEFIGLISLVDTVITCVTFGFHIAVAFQKKIVLLNNVFNKHEFYMYSKGKILEPDIPCLMCYKTKFDSRCHTPNCMDLIKPKQIISTVELLEKYD